MASPSQAPPSRPPPAFYCAPSGVYVSLHPDVALPTDDRLGIVSFLFSFPLRPADALIDARSGFSITHADVRRFVSSLSAGLADLGVAKNDVVLLLLPNYVLFPVALLGVMGAGAIVTTMSPLSTAEEVRDRISQCKPVLAITLDKNAVNVAALGVPVIAVPETLDLDAQSTAKFAPFIAMITKNLSTDKLRRPPDIFQDDVAAILYSSGTSGPSKGVQITHRNLISSVELFVRFEVSHYSRDAGDNVYLAALPMYHVYGMSLFAIGFMSLGATAVVMPSYNADEAIRSIERYKVTHFPVVPPMLSALLSAKRSGDGGCLESLVQVSSGAAPLSKKTIHQFITAFPGVDIIQGYGLTETTAVGSRGLNTPRARKYMSVGLLAPNTQAKVVLPGGTHVPPELSGELWLRGPGVMKGYYNDAAATSASISSDGWLKTGDMGYFDEDGYLYIVDRLKDTIKYKGFQVAPADLEELLLSCPGIADAAVTSLPDEAAGEIPVGFVVRKPPSSISAPQLMELVNKQVAPYKRLRKVVFVESIPRSPAGKVLRRLLRRSLLILSSSSSSRL